MVRKLKYDAPSVEVLELTGCLNLLSDASAGVDLSGDLFGDFDGFDNDPYDVLTGNYID